MGRITKLRNCSLLALWLTASAALGATAFGLTGATVSLVPFLSSSSALAWTPWLALAAVSAVRRPTRRNAALLGAAANASFTSCDS